MKNRKDIIYCIWLILFGLALKTPSEAQTLLAEFNDGRVHLTGSAAFECYPDGYPYGSSAVVTRFHAFSEFVTSGGKNISVNVFDENAKCKPPGYVFNYIASYSGGLWYYPTPEPVCGKASMEDVHARAVVPSWPEIIMHEPQDIVSGLTDITFNYQYFQYYDIDRRIQVYLNNNEKIYDSQNLSESGTIQKTYDFSNKKGFILLSVMQSCAGQVVPFEKLLYVEPEDSCQDKVGKPVSVSSGTVYANETDFSVKGAMPLTFIRYYDSTETMSRDFGVSWSHVYDTRVVLIGANTYKVINPDGSDIYYIDNNNDYIYDVEFPKGEQSKIIKNTNGSFTRDFGDGSKEEFNKWGSLTAVEDSNGNRTALTRDGSNKLTKITGPYGREMNILFGTGNKIKSITVPDGSPGGRVYSYTYLPSGYLGKVTYPDASERNYEYVYAGVGYRLSGIKDEKGNYIEKHTYDTKGRAVTSSADGTNELLTIDYVDKTHTTVTDSFGHVTTYTLDKTMGKSHATGISGPGCRECGQGNTFKSYNNNLNVTSRTDANGNVTAMTYDANGNMHTTTDAAGTGEERTNTYTYNSFGQILTATDPDGNTSEYIYDANGNMIEETDAQGNITTHTYSPYNEKLSTTDRNGNVTTYTYDQYGNKETITNGLGQTTYYIYDLMGNLKSMTDANGNATIYEYDLRDRLIKETRPDGGEVVYEYDAAGNKTASIDAMGNRTTYVYDNINRLIELRTGELPFAPSELTTFTYDSEGNMISKISKDSSESILTYESYTYDNHNRLVRTTYADGAYTEQSYDALGNVLTKRDENGNITTNTFDALNRLASVTDAEGGVTAYTHDSRDNLTSVTDANGNMTFYVYDSLNRLISTASPDTGTTTYTYDANGNMLTKTDANGVTTTYSYDALNRQTVIQFPDASQNIYYAYDDPQTENSSGKLTSMTDPSGTTWYDYDKMGRLIMETRRINALNYRTGYTYDLNGNVATITYPGGRQITYSYNQLNKVSSVTETYLGVTRPLTDNITYLPYGDITSITYGNGITTTKTYDNRHRLNSLTVEAQKQLSYSRDNVGNITSITDVLHPEKNKTYAYDAISRLTLANGPWGAITYAYDPTGNRTYETTDAGSTTYNYTINTNKLASSAGEKPFTFNYDNNGNTISELGGVTPPLQRTYVYNQNQRLVQALEGTDKLGEYVYNGNGQRVKKYTNNGSQCSLFHYDKNGLLIAESSSSGAIKAEYIYINGQPLAKIEGNNIFYYHNDHLGTPMLMTNSSGQAVWKGEFLPFGEPLSIKGTVTNNLRFPGQYFDGETGLHQNWFRDYWVGGGRYLSFDPLLSTTHRAATSTCRQPSTYLSLNESIKSNPFVYTENNPINFIDPKGLKCGSGWTDDIVPDSYGNFNFTSPCQAHDDCYGTCGTSKLACDIFFYNNMLQECRKLTWNPISQFSCIETAAIYYGFVSSPLGWYAYNKAQKEQCCK
jgi:RHS repeat-associated protein